MVMDMWVEKTAKPVDKNNCPKSGTYRGVGTALPDRGFHCSQENSKQATDNFRFVGQVPPDTFRYRKNPLRN